MNNASKYKFDKVNETENSDYYFCKVIISLYCNIVSKLCISSHQSELIAYCILCIKLFVNM